MFHYKKYVISTKIQQENYFFLNKCYFLSVFYLDIGFKPSYYISVNYSLIIILGLFYAAFMPALLPSD